ncbi:hypothetical protein F4677DRAFT_458709 [Hypoxylon crocopeplum]|nr:hypothetical protein F4677DRAFT_458709 [Hypoxylon crocopeplum]
MAPSSLSKKRRPHHKSRKGCQECKRRHVKCDEQWPVCLQCSMSDRECSSGLPSPLLQLLDVPARYSPQTPSPTGAPDILQDSSLEQPPHQVFGLGHLALFHHVETGLMKPPHTHFVADEKEAGPLLQFIVKSALSTQYLMDELLAFSALHLSVVTPDPAGKQRYRHQAVYLQTRALATFNTLRPDITEENCTTIFLFSSFTGMHMFYDTATAQVNLLELLDKFVQFEIIRVSELRSIIDRIEAVDKLEVRSRGECDGLIDLLRTAQDRLHRLSYDAYRAAIQSLQWVFDQHNVLPVPLNLHVVLSWPLRTSAEFLGLLEMRKPEASVILAHWAILLHRGRNFWVFDDAGRRLVEAISNFLGDSWDDWMVEPKRAISNN